MSIFHPPTDLQLIKHFTLPEVRTWGGSDDGAFRQRVRESAGLSPESAHDFMWFVFHIRAIVGQSRNKTRQAPDVENIPKLIVDAFTGVLYEDDNLHYVRGVQVEASWGADSEERTDVWIYGMPRETHAPSQSRTHAPSPGEIGSEPGG